MDDLAKKMENFKKLLSLAEDGDKPDTGMVNQAKLQGAVLLIYNSSKERICNVVDSIGRGLIKPGEELTMIKEPSMITLPDKEIWDFKLGDTVRVKYSSRREFRWIQRKTIGWRGNLNKVFGVTGIVTNLYSEYENSIGVYFPDVYSAFSIYAGALKKVPQPNQPGFSSRWKRNDYVKTISSQKVLQLLQRGLDQIPEEHIGKKGRVIGVSYPCVLVTYDEKTTLDLKGASLVPCADSTAIETEVFKHAREFKVGEEVTLISNLKKLIENQKEFGGWNEDMTPIRGKSARVIHIQKDGSLNLQTRNNRAWRINPDSALRSGEDEPDEEDLKILPDDIVKVILPGNIRSILAMAGVPSVFLEYLRVPAIITLVDDDFDYYIRFNHDQNVQTHQDIIRKATATEKEGYEKIQRLTESIAVGDKVHLDIGPPNFVQSVISELELSSEVKMALTRSAKLIGYVDAFEAIVEYEDGTRFRVKKKYLTVPEKFHMAESMGTVSTGTITIIDDALSKSVQEIHEREGPKSGRWKVSLIYMCHGSPPFVEFKVESNVAEYSTMYNWLEQHSGWEIESLKGGNQFIIKGAERCDEKLQIKVGIVFNNEVSEYVTSHTMYQTDSVFESIEERAAVGNKAVPIRDRAAGNERPDVNAFGDFHYLRLYNPALSRNVYFPYAIDGVRRTPIEAFVDNRPPGYEMATRRDRNRIESE